MGSKRLLLEMIPVVVGLKPAVDAFRVSSGAKIEEKQTFEPLAEMVSIHYLFLNWRSLNQIKEQLHVN